MSTIDLNPLPKLTVQTGTVSGGLAGSGNYYNFTINTDSIIKLTTDPIFTPGVSKGDSDLTLFRIENGSRLFTAGSTGITGEADSINTVLSPGDYTIEVLPFIGEVNYTLTIKQATQVSKDFSGFGIGNSFSIGAIDWGLTNNVVDLPDHTLVSDAGTIIDFLGHKGDLHDGYSFTVDKPTTVTFTLKPDANSNIDFALYNDSNDQIKGSFNDTGVADTVTADLKAGTYWLDAMFVSSNNPKDEITGAFTSTYDLSVSTEQYKLPVTFFRPFNGNAEGLANTFNFNNSQQPETITISNAAYAGKIEQSAVVNNFAGEVNAGVLLTTGDASSLLGHFYNQKQGQSTADAEIVKNWSNKNGNTSSMQPLTGAGNAAGYNADVFKEVSKLVTEQNKVLDADHQLDPISAVYDAASLSFDVAVTGKGNFLSFDLLFASEEFSLFADKYVDSAVIMVDGKNYALFDKKDPTTLLSVTQHNVDSGFFHSNTQLADGTSIYPTEFNGVSNLISVLAPIDTSLATHHISIAIADTNDHVLDSGVFLTNLDSLDLTRPTQPNVPTNAPVGREGLYSNEAGTAQDDTLAGTDNRDLSVLGGGNDQIDTGAGNDVVDGGTGNDSIVAGTGDDLLIGGTGDDTVDGGVGNDEIKGGTGLDSISGGDGNDVIQGGETTDTDTKTLDGGTGNDYITGAGGDDDITGGTGKDNINGGGGDDQIVAGTDNIGDKVNGGAGNDNITGGAGKDNIHGGTGSEVINGGVGNDQIVTGTDTIGDVADGGAGDDKITGGLGADDVIGGDGKDSVNGGAGDDSVVGGAGNDSVVGGTGDDSVEGGTGNDVITGGEGSDSLSGGQGTDTFVIDTNPDAGNVDEITDFVPVDDTIKVDNNVFFKLTITGTLNSNNFATGSEAVDSNDFLVYDPNTGALDYDADGSGPGAPVEIALLGTGLSLTSADFTVF